MNILKIVKHILPVEWLYKIKYGKYALSTDKLNNYDKKNAHIIFIDAPDYGNLGDQAIAYAIYRFFEENFSEYKFYEIQEQNTARYINFLKKNINQNDIIVLTGGGNMGNIYPIFEGIRRTVIKKFKHNKIIIFPQTIDYSRDYFGRKEFKRSKKIYSNHKNMIIMAREKVSYDIMKQNYNSRIILSPDIVLYLNYYKDTKPTREVGVCFRNDLEGKMKRENRENIINQLKCFNRSVDCISTMTDDTYIASKDREEIVLNKISEFSQYKIIVTDRLHAMIFCAITGTPCIALSAANHKIKGVYEWIKEMPYIYFIENLDDFRNALEKIEKEEIENYNDLCKSMFNIVIKSIKEGILYHG